MTYFPPDTENGTINPFPPTLVDLNDTKYEYSRRYGTLEDPPNLGSIATGKLAIIGVHTTPTFYKAIDINVGISSSVGQYISVHSEPHIFNGITTVTNDPYVTVGIKTFNSTELINAWHFKVDPFVSIASTLGVGSTAAFGVNEEFGFYFDKNVALSDYSFGFYYGDEDPGNGSLPSHKRWATFMETDTGLKEAWNFFEDLVLVGDYESIGTLDVNHPEPLVQILRPDHTKRGLYVRDTVGIGTTTDKRVQLYVDSTNNSDATHALKVIGNVEVQGTLSFGGISFEITNNTTLTINVVGDDGVTRSGIVTLS